MKNRFFNKRISKFLNIPVASTADKMVLPNIFDHLRFPHSVVVDSRNGSTQEAE